MKKINSIKDEYDIVIVGAGPAGSSFAKTVSKKYKVLMIDLLKFPRNKTCGGLLVEESQDFVKKWKIPNDVFSFPKYLNMKVLDWNNSFDIDIKRELWNIDRKKFDSWLLENLGKNISFSTNTKFLGFERNKKKIEITLNANNKTKKVTTNYLIGANGGLSNLRSLLTKKSVRHYTVIQHWIKKDKNNNIGENTYFIYDNEITDFYSWLIPKKNYLILGCALEKGSKIEDKMNIFTDKLKRKTNISGKVIKKESAILSRPENKNQIFLGKDNIFLIGEAAGFISSNTGEGISFALRSGYNCASAINSNSKNTLSVYKKFSKKLIKETKEKIKKSSSFSSPRKRKIMFQKIKN